MAVASDSRAVEDSSIKSDQCKLRRPSPRVLLAIDGLAKIVRQDDDEVKWDGLAVANDLFKNEPTVPSKDELMSRASDWQDSFQKYIVNGIIHPEGIPEGSSVVSLHLFAYIAGEPVVIRASFEMNAGKIVRLPPYEVPPPTTNVSKVIKYGSCNLHLGNKVSHADFTESERRRLANLNEVRQPTAISEVQLRELAADYLNLGSEISARLATDEEPADVAPPFTTVSFNLRSDQWKTYQSGACTEYLAPKPQPGPKRRSLRRLTPSISPSILR